MKARPILLIAAGLFSQIIHAQSRTSMTFQAKTVSVSINRKATEVYDYVSNPQHFPDWAPGFALSVKPADKQNTWLFETVAGKATVRFVPRNDLGVVDHYVQLPSLPEIYSPMRVLDNNLGSEVIFTVLRTTDMTEEKFAADIKAVQGDLDRLKVVMEQEK